MKNDRPVEYPHVVSIRLTPEAFEDLKRVAGDRGTSNGFIAREAVTAWLSDHASSSTRTIIASRQRSVPDDIKRLIGAINHVGGNLWQIARRSKADPHDLKPVLNDIRDLSKKIRDDFS